jgi:hypothetical protein
VIKKLYCDLCCYFENHRFSHFLQLFDYDTAERLEAVSHQYCCMSCGKERRYGLDRPLVVLDGGVQDEGESL